jgi:hypothetical protein
LTIWHEGGARRNLARGGKGESSPVLVDEPTTTTAVIMAPTKMEIVERDEAGNITTSYVETSNGKLAGESRIDVIVRCIPIQAHRRTGEFADAM